MRDPNINLLLFLSFSSRNIQKTLLLLNQINLIKPFLIVDKPGYNIFCFYCCSQLSMTLDTGVNKEEDDEEDDTMQNTVVLFSNTDKFVLLQVPYIVI